MTNLITNNFNEKIATIRQEQWTKHCQAGELSSPCKRFQRKNKGLNETGCQ